MKNKETYEKYIMGDKDDVCCNSNSVFFIFIFSIDNEYMKEEVKKWKKFEEEFEINDFITDVSFDRFWFVVEEEFTKEELEDILENWELEEVARLKDERNNRIICRRN